jgi:DNA-binding NtrC family response regulator
MDEHGSSPTILIVGQDQMLNELLLEALKIEFGDAMLYVANEQGALEMATHIRPDLFIIDDERFDLHALELSDRLHSVKERESVPTIIIDSHAAAWGRRQRYRIIFLRKPFDVQQFYVAVRQALTA